MTNHDESIQMKAANDVSRAASHSNEAAALFLGIISGLHH
jgi:hypothetical protein